MAKNREWSKLGVSIMRTAEEIRQEQELAAQDPFDPDFLWESAEDRCIAWLVKLTPQEERFCLLYALKSDMLFDAYECYLQVFEEECAGLNRKAIVARARRLLEKTEVTKRINQLLHNPVDGLSDQVADRQLYHLMMQNADLNVKLRAIEMYKKEVGKFVKRSETKNINANIIYAKVVWDPTLAPALPENEDNSDAIAGEWDEVDDRIFKGNR